MIKTTIHAALLVASLTVAGLAAGQGGLDNPQFAEARAVVQASQEGVIRDELRLTPGEETVFWPLYARYREDTLPIRDRYVALIADYLRQYETGILTNQYAEQMIDGYFEVKLDLLQERKRYVPEFAKILPMLKVARFYQLENKMTADVEAELALLVPLVEDH